MHEVILNIMRLTTDMTDVRFDLIKRAINKKFCQTYPVKKIQLKKIVCIN